MTLSHVAMFFHFSICIFKESAILYKNKNGYHLDKQ